MTTDNFKLVFEGVDHRLSYRVDDKEHVSEYVLERREKDVLGGDRWVQMTLHRQLRDGGAESRTIDALIKMLRDAASIARTVPRRPGGDK